MKAAIEGEMENLPFLESLYDQYLADPKAMDLSWQKYFHTLDQSVDYPAEKKERRDDGCRIDQLITAYRRYGHLIAAVNPLNSEEKEVPVSLDYKTYGFTAEDLSASFPTHGLLNEKTATLAEIIDTLREVYCGKIGFEYEGIVPQELEIWLRDQIETGFLKKDLSAESKIHIMESLNNSELLESFLHVKFVGQKRFSLEGGETLIPMLALMLEEAGERGVEEAVIGMSHRGRLNVLTNILNKSYETLLAEFTDNPGGVEGMGDVKYHKGYIGDYKRRNQSNSIKLTLCPNPSHLESVDSVAEGTVRAKQFQLVDEEERNRVIPLLIHGDAAISGQGVVYETLQLSQLQGYKTGGTLHFIINNQIGFTTLPRDMRSTPYTTDIAKTFSCPVFHVNGEDPESCVKISLLAFAIRQKFHCDVFIELNCYRKYGHNEGDEPAFTQPVEYKIIKAKKSIRVQYRDHLLKHEVVSEQEVDKLEAAFTKGLQEAHDTLEENGALKTTELMPIPDDHDLFQPLPTGISYETLLLAATQLTLIPAGFKLHPKLEHLVQEHLKGVKDRKAVDWAMGETLAYASLLLEGTPVRLSGQDSARGTFSHRHALWVDQETSNEHFPLAHLSPKQAHFEVINSPLSEMAVLAFEYGYSVAFPASLTIWEAQFGDFGNGAQIIIDQYIASGEQKWDQKTRLTLFLPHGYEGQGPEHSSARMERFLSLAGHGNMFIVNPTTPAQLFHLLRRQMHSPLLKPLIVFTPKGLLRHPACLSPFQELVEGSFQDILDDKAVSKNVRRVIFCSGRIYYDLLEKRKELDIAFVRIEQLYPLNKEKLKEIISQYTQAEFLWVQEEHKNMGAWSFIHPLLQDLLPQGKKIEYIGRSVSASPATGVHARHDQEKANIFTQVFQ